MERTDKDVDAFLDALPEDSRSDVKRLDREIAAVMKGEPRSLYVGKFWGGSDQEIIGYGTMTTRRSDKSEVSWFAIGLALQKRYISLYVNVVEDRQYLAEKYGPELGRVKIGKSSIGFASLADIDMSKLVALVRRAKDSLAPSV